MEFKFPEGVTIDDDDDEFDFSESNEKMLIFICPKVMKNN